jgi:hypothetical protein
MLCGHRTSRGDVVLAFYGVPLTDVHQDNFIYSDVR